jgi:hypothetical protein
LEWDLPEISLKADWKLNLFDQLAFGLRHAFRHFRADRGLIR